MSESISPSTPDDSQPARPDSATRTFFRSWIPWAIAAGLTVTCAWLGQLYLAIRTENALLRDQQALADLEIIGARHQTEAERILANRQLADNKRHLTQLEQQVDQSTRQLADARREFVEVSARLVTHRIEFNHLRDQLTAASAEAAQLKERLKTAHDLASLQIVTLTPPAAGSTPSSAILVWNPSAQTGVLRVEKLPAPAADQDYQLWIFDAAPSQPAAGGVIVIDPATGEARLDFKPQQPVTNVTKFAVTLERKGGAPKPEGPTVLLGH